MRTIPNLLANRTLNRSSSGFVRLTRKESQGPIKEFSVVAVVPGTYFDEGSVTHNTLIARTLTYTNKL